MIKKKVGIFSGTFDPVHFGHIEACLVAKSVCELSQVFLMIEKEPSQKSNIASYQHRKKMLELATQEYPSINVASIDEPNILSRQATAYLDKHTKSSEYWMILGSDLFMNIKKWGDYKNVMKNFSFCIVLRDNVDRKKVEKEIKNFEKKWPKTKIVIIPSVWSKVSSSSVKKEFQKSGYCENTHKLVNEYIKKNRLYDSTSSK